ncbi:MAG: class I SAM-dependent methyltransferase [Bacteroidetes bacterium]|nr:MAG: class I SAM-dependent methyltransferase [Bacteroidota bacterium]
MNDFWNERYATQEYAYGIEPNQYFKEQLKKLIPGKILFPAEGEGRNAVYAAKSGWEVFAFDPSTEGKRKAENLAIANGVSIDYQIAGYENVHYTPHFFDCIVLIFAHTHPLKRTDVHQKLTSYLKPGGTLILEGFSKSQISHNSGGPRDVNMLFSKQEMEFDFSHLSKLKINEVEVDLNEGQFHQGKAAVIRILGVK